MPRLVRALVLLLSGSALAQDTEKALRTIKAADIQKHQVFLSSDKLQGREAGSEGGHQAALYIAEQVKKWGLKPGGMGDSYFQPFGGGEPRKPDDKGSKNIIAVWPGTDAKLKDEYVVVAAHYDHVGLGFKGSNAGAGGKPGEIHNGADDNASGTSTLLDIAEAVGQAKLKRTVVCIWFDAEEGGLVGSRHWTANPTLDLAKCFAMINCDMIGRNEMTKIFCGVAKDAKGDPTFPKWVALVKEIEKQYRLSFDWSGFDSYIKQSDHWPFMEKGVPSIFFTAGLHADYHTDRDDIEKINFAKEELIGRFVFALLAKVANTATAIK